MIIKDDKVKMSDELKKQLSHPDSIDHLKEFGDCEGIVLGPCEYNIDGIITYDDEFVDVRWEPSGLRYGYNKNLLVKI